MVVDERGIGRQMIDKFRQIDREREIEIDRYRQADNQINIKIILIINSKALLIQLLKT